MRCCPLLRKDSVQRSNPSAARQTAGKLDAIADYSHSESISTGQCSNWPIFWKFQRVLSKLAEQCEKRGRLRLSGVRREVPVVGVLGRVDDGDQLAHRGPLGDVDRDTAVDLVLVHAGAVDDSGDGDELLPRGIGARTDAGDQQRPALPAPRPPQPWGGQQYERSEQDNEHDEFPHILMVGLHP